MTTVSYPDFGGSVARTVTHNYQADPDGSGPRGASPLVHTVSDPAGTIMTETDLVGRVIAYRDVHGNTTTYRYDLAGGAGGSGPAGAIDKVYDQADRLVSLKRDGLIIADGLTYDSAGRPTVVTFPSGAGRAGNGTAGLFDYDSLGR